MSQSIQERYAARLRRYVTALRNEKPDCVPIRPFVAEFAAKYAGYTCQQVTHDFELAFDAARKVAADFDWDATVANMVYVWSGLTEAIGLTYYGVPGIHVPADTGFQYREPPEDQAFMKEDEYDALIDDPTGYLFNTWLPRAARHVEAPGDPATLRNNLSFLRGGMAMMAYFGAFPAQVARLRDECGTAPAIAGILKAPLDILGDKFRGYMGLTMDLMMQREKVLKACEALAPHLLHIALSGADPDKNVPITIWMHRGGVPFVSKEVFDTIYWPTLKPIIEEIWARGHQTLFYAEGDWDTHLESFAELPEKSIIYHVDRGDIFKAHRVLGEKFCLSGGIPNTLLSYGTPDDVRARCKEVIDGVAKDGGYILDASAIIQNDALVENVQAMTDFVREYGVYDGAAYSVPELSYGAHPAPLSPGRRPPGVVEPWDEKAKELPPLTGDEGLVRRIWEQNDFLAHMFIWHCVVSF